jgi:hypothetical protein
MAICDARRVPRKNVAPIHSFDAASAQIGTAMSQTRQNNVRGTATPFRQRRLSSAVNELRSGMGIAIASVTH